MQLFGVKGAQDRHLAKQLLKYVCKEWWHIEPLPEIGIEPGGKPVFIGQPEICFNLSHSKGYALCGIAGQPLGVDIQIWKSWNGALYDRVCSPSQRSWLREHGDTPRAFACLWTLKESQVKYTGAGLTSSIRGIDVPLPGVVDGGSYRCERNGLHYTIYQGVGWSAALCSKAYAPAEIQWISETKLCKSDSMV